MDKKYNINFKDEIMNFLVGLRRDASFSVINSTTFLDIALYNRTFLSHLQIKSWQLRGWMLWLDPDYCGKYFS